MWLVSSNVNTVASRRNTSLVGTPSEALNRRETQPLQNHAAVTRGRQLQLAQTRVEFAGERRYVVRCKIGLACDRPPGFLASAYHYTASGRLPEHGVAFLGSDPRTRRVLERAGSAAVACPRMKSWFDLVNCASDADDGCDASSRSPAVVAKKKPGRNDHFVPRSYLQEGW